MASGTSGPAAATTGAVGVTGPIAGTVAGTVATDLNTPWGVGFLPDGDAVVTSRDDATVTRVGADGSKTELGTIPGVEPGGEGGLLGIAVSPQFGQDSLLYLYFTAADDNRVVTVELRDGRLGDPQVILDGIPEGRHARRRPAGLRTRRPALHRHRRRPEPRRRTGSRLPRREDPAHLARRVAGSGQPVP